jgi:hypothetical protein
MARLNSDSPEPVASRLNPVRKILRLLAAHHLKGGTFRLRTLPASESDASYVPVDDRATTIQSVQMNDTDFA